MTLGQYTSSTLVPLGFDDENFTIYSNLSIEGNLNTTAVLSLPRRGNLSITQMVIIAVIAGSLSIITVAGNIMVMVSFKIDKQLQTISNYFLFSLAVADFTVGLISMPLFTVYTIMGYWPLGAQICDLWLALDYLASNASVLNLLIISFDRYFSVTKPLTYRAKRSPIKAVCMIVTAWVVSLLLWPPWIYAWPYIEGQRTVPDDDCYIQFIQTNQYITFGTAIAAFYIPVTVMAYLYWRIWLETQKRQKELPMLQPASALKQENSKRSTSSDEQTALTEIDGWARMRSSSNTISGECEVMDTSFSTKGLKILNSQNNRLQRKRKTRRSSWFWLQEWCIAWWHSGHEDYDLNESYWEDGISQFCVGTPLSADNPTSTSFIKDASLDYSLTRPQIAGDVTQRNRFVFSRSISSDSVYTILIRLPAADPEGAGVEGPTIKMIPEQFSKTAPAALPSRRSEFATPSTLPINRRPSNLAEVQMPLSAKIISKQLETKTKGILPLKTRPAKKKKKPVEKKAEKKAAKTLSAILLAFILTWLPYNILVLLKPITAFPEFISEGMWNFFYSLCYVNSTINPLCYALCNATFRRTYMRILSCRWKRKHKRGYYNYP